ncbi:MAG: hypothetical protein QXZ31_07100 [Thermofilaceae archaeon]
MAEEWELQVPLPASWAPKIARCSLKTCGRYIAVLRKFTHGCLYFASGKEYVAALDELYTYLERKALAKLREVGLEPDELKWRPGQCWCPAADECLQLVAVYRVPNIFTADEIRRQIEKHYTP